MNSSFLSGNDAIIKEIKPQAAVQPLGHYSQAVVYGETVYVATRLGIELAKPACYLVMPKFKPPLYYRYETHALA